MTLYQALLLVTVTLHIPTHYRTLTGQIKEDESACTGVLIAPTLVLTAGHCLDPIDGPVSLKTSDYEYRLAIPLKIDLDRDLAVIRLTKPLTHVTKLAKQIAISDKVYNVNSGEDIPWTYAEGVVQNITQIHKEDNRNTLMTSIMIRPGASGSGLFNSKGELVGIETVTTETGSWAVDLQTLSNFLHEFNLKTN